MEALNYDATSAISSFFSCLSKINVPNGTNEAKKAKPDFKIDHCNVKWTIARAYIYHRKRTPCAHPTTVTAFGKSARYLRGIAMKRRTRNEIPSRIATNLKCFNLFIAVRFSMGIGFILFLSTLLV